MSKKNWNKIGRVTVKSYRGAVNTFASLEDAVRYIGGTYVNALKYGWLGVSYEYRYGWVEVASCGDTHIFLDELGLVIPVWRIQEAYRNLPNVWAPENRWYRFRGSKRFDKSYHHYRHPRTTQEKREGGRSNLPSSWDDLEIMARRNHNWKQFRKTRWK